MSSETSTEPRQSGASAGFQPWQFFILLSMLAATGAVVVSRHTHPLALLLLSAAVIATGLVAVAVHRALSGFFSGDQQTERPLSSRAREALEKEKAQALRAIRELEFDKAMGKISDEDFNSIGPRLRARAMSLMQELDRTPAAAASTAAPAAARAGSAPQPGPAETAAATPASGIYCTQCGTANSARAKFCKRCGAELET